MTIQQPQAIEYRQMSYFQMERTHKDVYNGHWFSDSAMKFFNTKLLGDGCDELGYFVTSEKHSPAQPRMYSIRRFNAITGEVSTVGEFQAYKTAAQANARIKSLHLQEVKPLGALQINQYFNVLVIGICEDECDDITLCDEVNGWREKRRTQKIHTDEKTGTDYIQLYGQRIYLQNIMY